MKAIKEKALDSAYVIKELGLRGDEAAHVDVLIRWLQSNKHWRKNRDNKTASQMMSAAIIACEEAFPDYNRRMELMNRLLGLAA